MYEKVTNTLYLITVPNMKTITTFFSEVSQTNSKFILKIAIITQIWHRTKFYFTCSPWYMIMVPNMKNIYLTIMDEYARIARQTDKLWYMIEISLINRTVIT